MKGRRRKQKLQRQIIRRRITPQARRRRRMFNIVMALVLVALLAIGGWIGYPYLWNSLCNLSYFKVTRITFAGLQRISEKELRAILPQIGGENLFSLDFETLKAKLECHPWVEGASLHRQLPDRLLIKIRERTPAALISREGLWAVDSHGVVLPLDAARGELDLPLLNIGPGQAPAPGVTLAENRMLAVLPGLEALRKRLPDLWRVISEVSWDEQEQIELLALDQPLRVLLGKDVSWRQMRNLYTFLIYQGQRFGLEGIQSLDLRFWGQVVVRRNSAAFDSTSKRII